MGYFYNTPWERVLDHYRTIGNSALIISGAPIDSLSPFEGEMKKAIEKANPNVDYDFFAVFHKDNKEVNNLERITNLTGVKLPKDTHFYIVTPLKKK